MDTAPIDQALEHADDVENLKKLRQLGGEGASHKLFVIVPLILSLALNSFLSFHNGWNFDNALQSPIGNGDAFSCMQLCI